MKIQKRLKKIAFYTWIKTNKLSYLQIFCFEAECNYNVISTADSLIMDCSSWMLEMKLEVTLTTNNGPSSVLRLIKMSKI